jgi:hypothetical protein
MYATSTNDEVYEGAIRALQSASSNFSNEKRMYLMKQNMNKTQTITKQKSPGQNRSLKRLSLSPSRSINDIVLDAQRKAERKQLKVNR